MGQATAELYPANISKGQRLVSGFRLLNRFLHCTILPVRDSLL